MNSRPSRVLTALVAPIGVKVLAIHHFSATVRTVPQGAIGSKFQPRSKNPLFTLFSGVVLTLTNQLYVLGVNRVFADSWLFP
jgi:hypothetical protein